MTPPEHVVTGWFDSHCHLQERYLTDGADASVVEALVRARGAGVTRMVCIGTDAKTSAQALDLARARAAGTLGPDLPEVWATVGLHPHEAVSGTDEVAALAEEAMAVGDGRLVAIGECGLDYYYEHSDRDSQRTAFAQQVALAHRLGLALVIHARDAWDDLFDVLAGEGTPERTVLHCFTGGPTEARRCLDAGMYLSFSGIVTFKNADELRAAVASCPRDRLLVETDSPFLAPVPHRGQPNEPALVPVVGTAIAELRGVAAVDLARSSAAAAAAAFAL